MNPAHEQIPLFGGSDSRPPRSPLPAPLARSSDPVRSPFAAAEVTASGRRDSQEYEILEFLLAQFSPVTSFELVRSGGFDRYNVARRLQDLERDGLVERGPMRECSINGRVALTWRAKGPEAI